MKDDLGNRMKRYENVTRNYLVPRAYTIIRVDGKAFHTFTRKFKRPFDEDLVKMMNATALYLAKNVQGCKMAYVQSDEISLVLTDFDELNTSAWFDGNIQKIVSVAASMATTEFNRNLLMCLLMNKDTEGTSGKHLFNAKEIEALKFAEFDARTYTLPTRTEAINYLIWRQKDAVRNSISMVAQSLYSHKELEGKSSNQQQEMIFQKDINWNNYDDGVKRGRAVIRVEEQIPAIGTVPTGGVGAIVDPSSVVRNKWRVVKPPEFTKDRDFLLTRIPENL